MIVSTSQQYPVVPSVSPRVSTQSDVWTILGVNTRRKVASAEIYREEFVPNSVASAKRFFRSTGPLLPPRFPRSSSTETPRSSKSTSMRCHGCHGVIGQGAHVGSGTGRNNCTLVHSNSCQGGITESDAFRACPDDYVFCPPVGADHDGLDHAGAFSPRNDGHPSENTQSVYVDFQSNGDNYGTPSGSVPDGIQRQDQGTKRHLIFSWSRMRT